MIGDPSSRHLAERFDQRIDFGVCVEFGGAKQHAIVDGIAGTRLPLLFHNSLDGSQSGALHVTITRCVSESAPFATEAAAQVNMAWRSRRASWER